MSDMTSRQVSWWSVHEFVVPKLDKAGDWPLLGTPSWCLLDGRDPAKWAALLDAAQHWALRLETRQEHLVEASHAIGESADWAAVANDIHQRHDYFAKRPWMKRAAS